MFIIDINEENELKSPELIELFILSRSLDGIFWGLLTLYIAIIATFQDLIFSTFPYLMCLPLFVILYSSVKIPISLIDNAHWKKNIQNLKIFSLLAAFTFPFIVFLVRGGTNNYFALCTIIAVYSFLRLLTSCAYMAQHLGAFYKENVLAKEAKVAIGFIYLSVIVASVYIFLVASKPAIVSAIINNGSLGLIIKVSMLIVIVFPLLLPVTLLFRLKTLVILNTKEKLRNY
ncbi:MAG: hypothetical protein NE328_15985 [Lentisphaeraceae bacterium]|nr:hypothetical protein [Lentisphaeraceae bacterium]